MDYRIAISKIARNLGYDNITSDVRAGILQDIEDVSIDSFNISQNPRKQTLLSNITTTANGVDLTSLIKTNAQVDLAFPLKIAFVSSGERVSCQEVMQDSFVDIDDPTDNVILYKFDVSEVGVSLKTKPDFTGNIDLYYSYFPEIENVIDTDNVKIHKTFSSIIVNGGTAKGLLRKISRSKNEVEMTSLKISYEIYNKLYLKSVNDYLGFVNNTVEQHYVLPADLLNDTSMNR